MHHIRATLPDIKQRITQQQQKYNAELATLGGPMGDGNAGNAVISVITEFTTEFCTLVDGNTDDQSLNELSGGARISFVFHELFSNGIKNIDPFDQVKDGDIRVRMYNSSVSSYSFWYVAYINPGRVGLYPIFVYGYRCFRDHRKAADQATGRAEFEVLSACIWRVDPDSWAAFDKDRELQNHVPDIWLNCFHFCSKLLGGFLLWKRGLMPSLWTSSSKLWLLLLNLWLIWLRESFSLDDYARETALTLETG